MYLHEVSPYLLIEQPGQSMVMALLRQPEIKSLRNVTIHNYQHACPLYFTYNRLLCDIC